MNQLHLIARAVALAAALGGCATTGAPHDSVRSIGPATDGASVRAILARQIAAPIPQRRAATIEGATAVEIYKNYANSYDNPRAQPAGSAFGR